MSDGHCVREFESPLTLEACQEWLLTCFEQSGVEHRIVGTVAWQEFRAWKAPRFGLGATPVAHGEIQPAPDGSLITVQLDMVRPGGLARAVPVVVVLLWLIWLGALALWLAGPEDAGLGPARLLVLLAVNLGMSVTYLAGRWLDREDPEDLLRFVQDVLDASE